MRIDGLKVVCLLAVYVDAIQHEVIGKRDDKEKDSDSASVDSTSSVQKDLPPAPGLATKPTPKRAMSWDFSSSSSPFRREGEQALDGARDMGGLGSSGSFVILAKMDLSLETVPSGASFGLRDAERSSWYCCIGK